MTQLDVKNPTGSFTLGGRKAGVTFMLSSVFLRRFVSAEVVKKEQKGKLHSYLHFTLQHHDA